MFELWKVTRAAFDAADSNVRRLLVQLRGDGDEGDDDGAAAVDRAVVYSQLGVAVRPVLARTLRALGIERGDEVAVLKLWDTERTPTDLDEGETRIYAAGAITRVIRMLAARIVVEAPEIRLGVNATKKVNRQGDPIEPGTFDVTTGPSVTVGPVTTTPVIITYTPPEGAPSVITLTIAGPGVAVAVTGPTSITLGGRTGPGSNKVRAED